MDQASVQPINEIAVGGSGAIIVIGSLAPLTEVSVDIEEAELVRSQLRNLVQPFIRITKIPSIFG
jgi:hypothetical protein